MAEIRLEKYKFFLNAFKFASIEIEENSRTDGLGDIFILPKEVTEEEYIEKNKTSYAH